LRGRGDNGSEKSRDHGCHSQTSWTAVVGVVAC
jgi:hypothetical protein